LEFLAMKCISALSLAQQTGAAIEQVRETLRRGLAGERADLTLVFSSMHHADDLGQATRMLLEQGLTRHVLGCTAESVVGEDREIEGDPALAAWSIALPGVEVDPLRLEGNGQDAVERLAESEDRREGLTLLLGDPFSFQIDEFLRLTNLHARSVRVMGGMASGSQVPRGNQLVLDGEAFHDGAVGLLLSGPLSVRTIVSQGCRPVGRTLLVTKAEHTMIRELGRRPALEVLREVFQELPPEDQQKVQQGLHIGRVINEYQDRFQRGDFLVRNVMGADESGAIQITDLVRVGQTVQFHVRDAETADEDLRESLLLAREQARETGKPAGALLFTCNGRGSRLFDEPDHDVRLIREILGPIPVAGLFAMGEVGPIGGQNFVHGFTASVLVFEEPA
jgi:small ligand-binding sensory domain FIST